MYWRVENGPRTYENLPLGFKLLREMWAVKWNIVVWPKYSQWLLFCQFSGVYIKSSKLLYVEQVSNDDAICSFVLSPHCIYICTLQDTAHTCAWFHINEYDINIQLVKHLRNHCSSVLHRWEFQIFSNMFFLLIQRHIWKEDHNIKMP